MSYFRDVRVIFTVIQLCLVTRIYADDEPFCTKATSKTSKRFPTWREKYFFVDYRATFVDKGYTMTGRESYEDRYSSRQTKIEAHINGATYILMLDRKDMTYIDYFSDKNGQRSCQIKKLDGTESNTYKDSGFIKTQGKVPLVSIKTLLTEPDDQYYVYIGEENIDGIQADHWRGCLQWKDMNVTFTVDMYLNEDYATKSKSYYTNLVPIQIVIKGESGSGSAKKKFHHVYEFFNYKAVGYFPPEAFSLPDFTVCKGEVKSRWQKSFIELPKSISYTLETVMNENKGKNVVVETKTIQIDTDRHFYREQIGKRISISDFSLGVEFLLENSVFKARAIDPANVRAASRKGDKILMVDTPEIAYLKQDFYFAGSKLYRSKKCSMFTGYTTENEVIQAYVYGQIVYGFEIFNPTTQLISYYNIFNFHANREYDEQLLDIGNKVSTDHITEYTALFSSSFYDDEIDYYFGYEEGNLAEYLRDNVADLWGVSIVQISHISLNLTEDKNLRWTFSFIEPFDKSDQAKVADQKKFKTKDELKDAISESYYTILTYESEYYSWKTDLQFQYFENTDDYISISTIGNLENSFQKTNGKCVDKLQANEIKDFKENSEECAKYCIENKVISCNFFQYTKASKLCQISSKEKYTLISTPGCSFYQLDYLRRFERSIGGVSLSKKGTAAKIVTDKSACAKMCLAERSFQCESFDYCAKEGSCILRNTHFYDSDPVDNGEVTSCEHYSRNILDDYHSQPSTKISFPDQVVESVEKVSQCASLCSTYEEGCHSFTLCSPKNGTSKYKQQLKCTLLPLSKKSDAKITSDDQCYTYTALGSVSARVSSVVGAQSGGYTGGSMFGLAVGMILSGVGIGVLTVFLLKRFQIWQGF